MAECSAAPGCAPCDGAVARAALARFSHRIARSSGSAPGSGSARGGSLAEAAPLELVSASVCLARADETLAWMLNTREGLVFLYIQIMIF